MELEYRQLWTQAKKLSVFINPFAGQNEILQRTFYITETSCEEARAFQQVFWTHKDLMLCQEQCGGEEGLTGD